MPGLPPAAAAAWLHIVDGLVRGLNHGLSNRVNTLNTLLAVLQDTRELDAEIEGALMGEEERFEAMLRLFRLLPLEGARPNQPTALAGPVADAVALFAHHLELRMLPCRVVGLDAAPPVQSRQHTLTQVLLLVLVTVGRAIADDDWAHGLVLQVTSAGNEVVIRASTALPTVAAADDTAWVACEWMASTLGATTRRGRDDTSHAWAELALPNVAVMDVR